MRKAEEQEWQRSNPEARARAADTVTRLRDSISQLEGKLEKARAAGNDRKVREFEEAISARRAWLDEAEKALNEMS